MHRNLFGDVTYRCGHIRQEIVGSKNSIADFVGESPKDASRGVLSITKARAANTDCPICQDLKRTIDRLNALASLDGLSIRFGIVEGKVVVLKDEVIEKI